MAIRRKKKQRPKVEIVYPPLTTKTWIPPDQRKRKKRKPKWVKPPELTLKLDVSNLKKIWHAYRLIAGCGVLYGHYGQTHCKFLYTTNGLQGPANCVIAILFSKISKCPHWDAYTLDEILNVGDRYFAESKKFHKCKKLLHICDLNRDLYIYEHKITIDFKGKRYKGWVQVDLKEKENETLKHVIQEFFEKNEAGVVCVGERYFAIWKYEKGFYLFDPTEHDIKCLPWKGLPGQGTSFLIRFPHTDRLVQILEMNLPTVNINFDICPISIERLININTNYPQCLEDANLEILDPVLSKKEEPLPPEPEPEPPEELPSDESEYDFDEDDADEGKPSTPPDAPKHTESPKAESPKPGSPLEEKPKDAKVSKKKKKNEVDPNAIGPMTESQAKMHEEMHGPLTESQTKLQEEHKEKIAKSKNLPGHLPVDSAYRIKNLRNPEFGPLTESQIVLPKTKKKKLVDKPIADDLTFYTYVEPHIIGILMADLHQDEDEFEICRGKLDLPNALAALTMLREHRSCEWTTKIVNSILKLGFRICVETLKKLKPLNPPVTTKNVIKKIDVNENAYSVVITQYGAVGRLSSLDDSVLDLLPALREVLSDYDTVIVNGPLVLGIWKEGNKYYLFDPVERDPNGNKIIKEIRVGSIFEAVDFISGVACVMWFKDLKDLVAHYVKNVDRLQRRDQFILSTVEINKYQVLPEDWRNFVAIDVDRWLLRGNFSQADRRFNRTSRNTQCTATAAMAIVYAHLVPIAEWTSNTIDDVITKGDAYYTECIEALKKKEKFKEPMLLVVELLTEFMVDEKLVCLDIAECLMNGYISWSESCKVCVNLQKGLAEFFKDNDFGIFTCRGISVALWRKGDTFFYFDSHDRNRQGFHTHHGKACIQRISTTEKLAECLMGNLAPSKVHALYNLSRLDVETFDPPPKDAPWDEDDYVDEEEEEELETDPRSRFGVMRPLYNYTQLTKKRAILRAKVHEGDVMFGIGANKHTIPNLVAAAAMARLFNPATWDVEMLDDIFTVGTGLYESSMHRYYKSQARRNLQEEEDADDNDDITIANCADNFKIGVNKISLEFRFVDEAPVMKGEQFKASIKAALEEEGEFCELILHTGQYDVVIWKNAGLYYVFDPKARDTHGDVYGKADWSIIVTPEEQSEEEISEFGEEELWGMEEEEEEQEGEGEDTKQTYDQDIIKYLENEWKELAEIQEEEEIKIRFKHPPEYWLEMAEKEGKGYVMWFTKIRCLLKHLFSNLPMKERDLNYVLTKVVITNEPEVKDVYDPAFGPKEDGISGDWHDFKEIDRGQWILRGTIHQKNELFPEGNRGNQFAANCLIALAYAYIYALPNFNYRTVDSILKYGDRLYTVTKKLRKSELAKVPDVPLTETEIEEVARKDIYDIAMLPKRFCIGDEKITAHVEQNFCTGEVHAKNVDEEVDVQKALEIFYEDVDNQFAVLEAKETSAAVWRTRNFYFLFYPQQKGPRGNASENGVACVLRFRSLEVLAKCFVRGMPRIGKNFFGLHKVSFVVDNCAKPAREEMRIERPATLTGYINLRPGIFMIRGGIHQDHHIFGRGTNAQCAPIALVSLAMTLVHNCEYWTRPIIDEIICIGDSIYGNALDRCDLDFNPWEEKMTIAMAPNDFKIGKIKVNCERRHTEQRGIIDIKDPTILNLRAGVERFFEENSYGVIETDFLTVAIWEMEDESNYNYIYMFDPNPRGPTGQPWPEDGAACVIKFVEPKAMTDHIISLLDADRDGQFLITPVEIVIERDGKRKKTKKYGLPRKPDSSCERMRNDKLGKLEYYAIPHTEIDILRGSKSQNWQLYSQSSRGNQDVPNCIVSYVMDKVIPLANWNCKIIDMVLDVGDQLYKDSYIIYNPKDKKLRLETLIRDVLIKDIKVKISVGAPVLTAKFNVRLLNEALQACFNLKNFCIVLVEKTAVSLFLRDGHFYLFDPTDMDLSGCRCEQGTAAVLRFTNLSTAIDQLISNLSVCNLSNEVFHIIVVAIKEIEKVRFGATQGDAIRPILESNKCDKYLYGHYGGK
ncbi:PREDICTED: uncharacterized protein LOC108568673 [Nicrophorus vespilloides]|uniref:Uncharacterized protein LOC108568673 n=1 Tax=Nicrophorus vespilloides TaxID=110193 RepID=A0ABM1NEX1_NICVS|nr:PREDICTED: uncharacterized protein LOC108568673 [Nicrophorus vespilloides]